MAANNDAFKECKMQSSRRKQNIYIAYFIAFAAINVTVAIVDPSIVVMSIVASLFPLIFLFYMEYLGTDCNGLKHNNNK
jgi:hypothetical protein